MELPVRKRLPHAVPSWVESGSFFFITFNCEQRGQNQLARAGIGDAIFSAAAFYHEPLRWHCRLMLLMPNHLHAIIAFPDNANLRNTVQDWKKYLARIQSIAWQRDFFDHRLRNQQDELKRFNTS
jgi:REP element-mobilizing transposase RayT